MEFFHFLTSCSQKKAYKHLIISPVQMEKFSSADPAGIGAGFGRETGGNLREGQ